MTILAALTDEESRQMDAAMALMWRYRERVQKHVGWWGVPEDSDSEGAWKAYLMAHPDKLLTVCQDFGANAPNVLSAGDIGTIRDARDITADLFGS